MTNTRALQRSLFRMQMDPSFAERVFGGEPEALASTGLAADDLALLRAADPTGVRADRDGKRLRQMLGNVAAEFALSLAVADDPDGLLAGFPASDHFHRAIREDESLPLAFGAWVRAHADGGPALRSALAALETSLAHARRCPRTQDPPRFGELVLAPWAHLFDLPAGTHAAAMKLQESVDAGRPASAVLVGGVELGDGLETLLVVADPGPEPWPHRLPDVRLEELVGPVAKLLRRARLPLDIEARRHLAAQIGVPLADLDDFAATLVQERVLIAG